MSILKMDTRCAIKRMLTGTLAYSRKKKSFGLLGLTKKKKKSMSFFVVVIIIIIIALYLSVNVFSMKG